ncbi:CoA transferase [Xenorhabdus littoralis]|uniref:CoA transferase n=1 Tax=Xenorhabdus littoralis TaxID=2582835 RepID=UPI0029E800A8|nr:CoA transferase [Xenorhabdus sp. psl]MDX7991001.1 carnitine dehydratase [Xenorhabdus sp. psl]
MPRIEIFQSLRLSGTFSQVDAAFAPFIRALHSQAKKIGIVVDVSSEQTTNAELVVILQEQDGRQFMLTVTSPVINGQVCGEVELQALTGLASVHSRSLDRVVPLGVDYISVISASLVLQQLLAGLIAQHRGNGMQSATFDLVQAGVLAVGQYLAGATTETGAEVFSCGEADVSLRPPFTSLDGVLFELESLSPQLWQRFWVQLGADIQQIGRGWHTFMQRYAKGVASLSVEMVALLASHVYTDLADLAHQTGIAITPVRRIQDRKMDRDLRSLLEYGPWSIKAIEEGSRKASRMLSDFSTTSELPLAGIRLVESCRRIQGPMAGHLLAMFGATVTRIEPLGGDPLRDMPPLADNYSARFQALNARKQVVEVNIKSAEGKKTVEDLVHKADLFIHNWAPGKASELALDVSDLTHNHPDLVYVYAGGWGELDSEMTIPGTDFMVQAYSGMADVIAQRSGVKGGTLFTATDIFGGILAAQAAIMALYCRVKGASGLSVRSSLLGAATMLIEPILTGQSSITEMDTLPEWCCTDLASLSIHPHIEPYLMAESYTQLCELWRPL